MFGIGMPEMFMILAIALIVIGPKKLPDLAKSIGKALGEFKKATQDVKDSMGVNSNDFNDVKKTVADINETIKSPVRSIAKKVMEDDEPSITDAPSESEESSKPEEKKVENGTGDTDTTYNG
ncbi:MAG: twin-arginine translocase TatA/TatE family subunit [Desulfobacterales bacterium]|nr:twin-arginine translocase TatA/TatE family subunit [Desulfobacterales bacterium]